MTDVSRPDQLSSAQIASICQAAGLQGKSFREHQEIGYGLCSMHYSRAKEPICYLAS